MYTVVYMSFNLVSDMQLTSFASFSPLSHAVSFLGGATGSALGCVLSAISSSCKKTNKLLKLHLQ